MTTANMIVQETPISNIFVTSSWYKFYPAIDPGIAPFYAETVRKGITEFSASLNGMKCSENC